MSSENYFAFISYWNCNGKNT